MDVGGGEEAPGGQAAVVHDGRLEEVDDVLVLDVLGPVAWQVEGGVAGCVFAELVAPEVGVGRALVDPVPVCICLMCCLSAACDAWC